MKNIMITGAGTGLGKALAIRYAEAGNHIILLGRTEERLIIAKEEIIAAGGSAEAVVCDVTEQASIQEAIRQFNQVDVLINNAGIGIFGELSDYTEEDIDTMMNTNIKGTILMTKAILPYLETSKGRVLNIISTAGLRGKVNESVYCASKFAVRGFTESLQKEWENRDITATAVYMGGMATPFWEESDHIDDPSRLKDPAVVAEQIFTEDDGRPEITIKK
ncbi:SDR family NAD(P)-dependent oxidoreductase [Thalassobacillus hwangdonensis]|uniref:SDR family NAD(P)-dependent oxidoreductase n=1 Tax=Thalassobacillus hwangdonensis TaxID=546108 RepID=A0ABW3L6D7_9BACI